MKRPCLSCGTLAHGSRCPPCQRLRNRVRGTTTQRGYSSDHQRRRAQLLATYSYSDPCAKCGQPLGSNAALLDLGHTADRTGWTGLEHRSCNRATARRQR